MHHPILPSVGRLCLAMKSDQRSGSFICSSIVLRFWSSFISILSVGKQFANWFISPSTYSVSRDVTSPDLHLPQTLHARNIPYLDIPRPACPIRLLVSLVNANSSRAHASRTILTYYSNTDSPGLHFAARLPPHVYPISVVHPFSIPQMEFSRGASLCTIAAFPQNSEWFTETVGPSLEDRLFMRPGHSFRARARACNSLSDPQTKLSESLWPTNHT
ncbi:hypothetical protein C8R47DRAFT_1135679 [Mycena vitilis]|nr:hypothetical protein C8R47DRAFT_1135679 [Mycena vitilis]